MENLELTQEQKDFVIDNFQKTQNLNDLTRLCFKNDKLDGRSKEGRAIRAFLANNNFNYKTTAKEIVEVEPLTDSQKDTIRRYAGSTKVYDICKILWSDRKVTPLSKEYKIVCDYIKEVDPKAMEENDDIDGEYTPPKTIKQLIKKVTEATTQEFIEEELTEKDKEKFEILRKKFLNSPRYLSIMNYAYTLASERRLFELEFIRTAWDKLDLNPDEINLCLNLCSEYVNQSRIARAQNLLTEQFENAARDTEGGAALSIKLTEAINSKNEELNQCVSRQGKISKELNGSRGDRIKKQIQTNASFLSIINAFMDKEERDKMIKLALAQKKLVKDEMQRLETMGEWKARIVGLTQNDVIADD